ncbi:MAG: hypothetical protein ACLP9L_12535, partial [Thermoguttaceae bacterium]
PQDSYSTNRNHWYNSHSRSPTINPLSILRRRANVDLQAPRDTQWFRWLPKGWPVLIAVAAVGLVVLAMFVWFGVALVFRRRFQFSLRSLLLVALVIAILCKWLVAGKQQTASQRDAVREIEKSGGQVCYDWELDSSLHRISPVALPGLSWLRDLLGHDQFGDVLSVNIRHYHGPMPPGVRDFRLEPLKSLHKIRSLSLVGAEVTDDELQHVERLSKLQYLSLAGTQVTDAGLEHLAGLTQLATLVLSDTYVTDAGVAKIQKALPNCEIIR